jgi:AraC-like DNA-binding protein
MTGTAPEHANIRLSGIARRWCFSDFSSFNRAFRQTFAFSPRQARAAALSGLSALSEHTQPASLARWIAQICATPPRV